MLPDVKPTGRRGRDLHCTHGATVQDGKVAHEHIYCDQASVLVQVGLLDPAEACRWRASRPRAKPSTKHSRAITTRWAARLSQADSDGNGYLGWLRASLAHYAYARDTTFFSFQNGIRGGQTGLPQL